MMTLKIERVGILRDPENKMANDYVDAPITMAEVQAAIDGNEFILEYQPKIDCKLLSVKGFEALIRWESPTRGTVMPSEFIPAAEEYGLIGKLTELIVGRAFRWYKSTQGVPGLSLSINFSAKRLNDLDFADWLQRMCRTSMIRHDDIILEVDEPSVMDQRLLAFDMFTRLTNKGFRVAIDDFGLGPAALKLLARLPFSEVKIDKSFAMAASTSAEAREFIRETVAMSHSLKFPITAEGVEDVETLHYLQSVDCDFAQGYIISRPMPGDQVVDWMVNRRQRLKHLLV